MGYSFSSIDISYVIVSLSFSVPEYVKTFQHHNSRDKVAPR